jgi:putative flippase GtrA
VLRFVVVGGTNTLITAAAFYGLATVIPARVAFTVVYLAGITFNVLVTPAFVFGVSASTRRRLLLGLWYLTTYLVGIGVISLLDDVVDAPRAVVVAITVAVTAPLSFAGARLLVGRAYPAVSRSGSGSTPSG